jgi:DNA (cytosine-5)-methyltransferase 1
MNHGSLFSGIGGFDLAAEWMGWNNVFHCEWNPFGQRVLKHYWPNAISYDDITKTDFTIHRGNIDILTGGFPCQPYSAAGKRLGKEDDRHLWPEMLRAIREIQPTWVVGENVRGLTNWNGGMVFDEVQADLEAEGYEVTPFLLPACAVNAPHRRDRIWFVAYSAKSGIERMSRREESALSGTSSNTSSTRQHRDKESEKGCNSQRNRISLNEFDPLSESWVVTNSINEGLQRGKFIESSDKEKKESGEQPSGSTSKLHKIENWEQFPTQSPVCNGDDGLSSRLDGITFPEWRSESIKAGGNAIVPQVALQIFKAITRLR